jgi:branched-subunit amino acid aminotransferase/4-amino-4-deoxychorismate lyase
MERTEHIWLDGTFVPWEAATVHVLTHTLHYGMGVFEGVRCYEGATGSGIFRLTEHTERLFASAHILGLEIPFSRDDINNACLEAVRRKRHEVLLHPAAGVFLATVRWDSRRRTRCGSRSPSGPGARISETLESVTAFGLKPRLFKGLRSTR